MFVPFSTERFQFTPLREGRLARLHVLGAAANFNSRPSARGDQAEKEIIASMLISIHAPPRGATDALEAMSEGERISIHAPPRGATSSSTESKVSGIFQFTPLREGRLKLTSTPLPYEISIHAPPRGATNCGAYKKEENLFQFTPLREGRRPLTACTAR